MKTAHVLLAVVVAVTWGLNFVAIRIGLDSMPPLLLAAVRFLVAGLPALCIARPRIPWRDLATLALVLFVVQFAALFLGMDLGMPPGLASVVAQTQALFTAVLAALFLHEHPSARQKVGLLVGLAGIVVLMSHVGFDGTTWPGMLLTLAAPMSWSAGNILLRRTSADVLPLMAWLSLLAGPILLALSLVFEGVPRDIQALGKIHVTTVAAIVYIGPVSTLLGYGLWGHLLKLYPASTVAPFSLMVPVFGALSANLVFGERFGAVRLIGMGLILASVAIIALRMPKRRTSAADDRAAVTSAPPPRSAEDRH